MMQSRTIVFFLLLISCATHVSAQKYLSVENEKRLKRYKAFEGDKIRIRMQHIPGKISGTLDSLALDGTFKLDGRIYHTDSIDRVYRKDIFKPEGFRLKFLGTGLIAGSVLYMGGMIVNGWILSTGPAAATLYTAPLIILGTGLILVHQWKPAYKQGKSWRMRVLQY